MGATTKAKELREQLKELRARLNEAEDVLSAIRNGEVDALVVSGEAGEQVYTLQTAERPYRLLIEAMNEGAVTVNSGGIILYCNQCFATMLDLPLEQVLGAAFADFIPGADLPLFEALWEKAQRGDTKGELTLKQRNGRLVPVQLSCNVMPLEELMGVSIVVTDLTESRRHAEMTESANLARSILEQAAEAMVVCDDRGRVIHASRRAHKLCGRNPMLRDFDDIFTLVPVTEKPGASDDAAERGAELTFASIRRERELQGVEVTFARRDGASFDLLLSAGAVQDGGTTTLGWVINLTSITELKQSESEREQLLARERAARREAEESSRLKDEFLANVSHELRTPLNAMLGWARLLRVGNLDQAATSHAVETIERNARSQNQLIDDLLDVSRIITGNLRLDVRTITPATFIDAAIEAVHPAAEAKEIVIQQTGQPDAWSVRGDAARLQQVIWNLLSNAIKFTPRNGRVDVRVERRGANLLIAVDDSGEGVNTEFLPFVFDRFRQADGTTTRRHGGLGLGLAIVRQLIELHGGTVQVESPGPLGGATFCVNLPFSPVYQVLPKSKGKSRAVAAAAPAVEQVSNLDGLEILVIDDEIDTLELIKMALGQYGAKIWTAGSSAEAFTVLDQITPAIILGDIGMPEEDGYEFIRKLRALSPELGGQIPAVALTAYARPEDRARVLESGYQMHLSKPVEITELVAVVANIVGRS
jgi:PAS domain S-box-containing protein